jgi:hypothetical protein
MINGCSVKMSVDALFGGGISSVYIHIIIYILDLRRAAVKNLYIYRVAQKKVYAFDLVQRKNYKCYIAEINVAVFIKV